MRYRIIADHSRTAAILIGDGVSPGNDGRGYVLRRLLRRVVRSAKLLGIDTPIVGRSDGHRARRDGPVVPRAGHRLRPDQPHRRRPRRPRSTARWPSGSRLFDEAADATKASGATVVSGSDAFTLHDTYGFPIDLTLEMAAEAGLTVDEAGFRELMAEQRQRAKADAAARKHAHADLTAYRELVDAGPTEFTGFDELTSEARILGIFVDGKRVPVVAHAATARRRTRRAGPGPHPALRRIRRPDRRRGHDHRNRIGASAKAAVTDVQKIAKTLWVHRVNVESGEFVEGDTVVAAVDPRWRHGATQGHSGTHMVHAALRQVLGPNAVQAGSLNRPGYLRFDFNWQGALTEDQRTQIEEVTNEAVEADFEVHTFTDRTREGQGDGRDGALRRGLSRRGAGGRDRRAVLAGALRRDARAQLGADRARSRSSANRRSVPACAGSRPTSGWTRSATWPRSAR